MFSKIRTIGEGWLGNEGLSDMELRTRRTIGEGRFRNDELY